MGKKIPLSRIPAKIKAKKGIDGVYKLVKEKNREARELQDAPENTGSSSTESRASEPDERASAARKSSAAQSEPEVAAGESPEVSSERLTVKWILDNHLLIKMPKEEKERYIDGSARRGQRRQLDTTYGGRGAHNLHDWEYVYGRDVDAGPASREDNDNEVNYENESGDEDAA